MQLNDIRSHRGFHVCTDGNNTISYNDKTYIGKWVYGLPSIKIQNGVHSYRIFDTDERNKYSILRGTLAEYTGRVDYSNQKIFVNDIVKSNFSGIFRNYLVTFRDGSYGLVWIHNDVEYFAPFTSFVDSTIFILEGNIFSNHNLISYEGVV